MQVSCVLDLCVQNSLAKNRYRANLSVENLKPDIIPDKLKTKNLKNFLEKF